MANKRRIGILTGGGDVPGLNAAIKAAVRRAHRHGIEVLGLRRGWLGPVSINPDDPGTLNTWTLPLTLERVRTIDRTGGTILHSSRTNPANMKPDQVPDFVRPEDRTEKDDGRVDITRHVLRVFEFLGLDALVAIGGDDTLSYAARLHREGFPVLAIPKTMDNDVNGTDYCIGFSTAVSRAVELTNNFRTSVGSHERIGVVEVFGRYAGFTALFTALLADTDRVLIPEVPFNIDKVTRFLVEDREQNPSHYAILVISEGAYPEGGTMVVSGEEDAYGHKKLGGIGYIVAQEIKKRSGINIMYQQLGYVMRSGPPDTLDRLVAMNFGTLAVDALVEGISGHMTGLQKGQYTLVDLDIVAQGARSVDVDMFYDKEAYKPHIRAVQGLPMFLY